MNRPLLWYDYITFNIYFLGLTFLSQTNGLIAPLLVSQFVGEAQKGSYYGTLRLWTLMVAVLTQAFWGLLSDRSRLPWGRRRPFIFVGTLATMLCMGLVGFLFASQGLTGFILLFVISIFMSIASNMPQAAAQALIPDLVPANKRGIFSGIKAVLEIPLPVILVSLTVGRFLAQGNTWSAVIASLVALGLAMLVTMLVPEERPAELPAPLDWKPYIQLVGMTAAFTLLILGLGLLLRQFGLLFGGSLPVEQMLAWLGLLGLAAMLAAVFGGVWMGVRIGLGAEAGRNRSFTWWVINRLAFLIGVVNLSTFAVFYFQSRLGYSQMQAAKPASQLIYVVGVMIFLTALVGGWLADRIGQKRTLGISGLLAAAGAAIMLLTNSLAVITLGGAVVGVAAGMFYAANWALGTSLAPKEQAARYLGISNLAGAGAGAIGAYIGGPIADYFSLHAPDNPGLGYVLLFVIYGILFLFSTLALTQIHASAQPES